ncbi:filamentous hemagglutinin N-terminal domain-containing protein [Campylobacter jejuni]|nr:filamentous hemagglutinin N-terminal domain-containing protein [Campylobacter jejuni]EAK0570605.1 filamentous hemagglutinin N-terminal domain-containing protein [Campylobacter jejuni]
MKKLNKLSLSLVVGSLLFTQSYALPSGGKFTHGTSGSININDKVMDITGKGQNSVIQWGGGFNIANGETVNFQGNGYNYLNIVYGSKSSHIDGTLNGGSNNIFLINPNGIVVGKGGSISAKKIVLSTSSVSDDEMKEFASSGRVAAFEYNKDISPVIKPNAGNVINTGNIKGDYIGIVTNQYANFNVNGDIGSVDSPNTRIVFLTSGFVSTIGGFTNAGWIQGGVKSSGTVQGHIQNGSVVYETNDKIASTDIDSNVMNSIFSDLKFNSSVDISDLNKFYKDGKVLTADELTSINQSIDFITVLYGQASASENAKLKQALGSYYSNMQTSINAINTVKNTLPKISEINKQQENAQKTYDDAVETYNKAVEAYNTALNGITGNNGDKVLAGLKQAVDKASSDLQQATTALKDATSSNNSNLETNKQTIANASIDNYKLTVNGQYSANLKDVSKPNDNNSGSNNGNDGTDSGDINNGNNNGSNNNPNDTIGQQEPDIATALLMQTTDEDPNINEDDKQASIDEASTQESGNACIVSDNFKAGNPCSR